MKQLLIQTLETICPDKVFLQGTLNPNEAYPDEFITFWTDYTDDNAHYDNSVKSVDWNFSVIFYSNNPDRVASVPALIRSALKMLDLSRKARAMMFFLMCKRIQDGQWVLSLSKICNKGDMKNGC